MNFNLTPCVWYFVYGFQKWFIFCTWPFSTLLPHLKCLVRFVNPANRGSLAVSMLLLYVLMGFVAGYASAVQYKSFKGRQWQQCTLMTALLFPSICFIVFMTLNLISQRYHSTQVNIRYDWLISLPSRVLLVDSIPTGTSIPFCFTLFTSLLRAYFRRFVYWNLILT